MRFRQWLARLRNGRPKAGRASAACDPIASRDAITRFLFVEDEAAPVDLCFVLGCPTPSNMDPAIALHAGGLAPLILISGHGPAPQPVPESVLFRDYAMARGVPEAAMLLETEATNTKENFTLSAPLIAGRLGWERIRRVALVAKPYHMRRAIMTARRHWPAHLALIAQPSREADDFLASNWWQTPVGREFVLRELRAIGTYGLQDDIGGF